MEVNIIFPHQLFEKSPLLKNGFTTYIIEEHLFFKQFNFHKQKILFHRASMKFYESYLNEKKIDVKYIEASDKKSDIRVLLKELSKQKIAHIHIIEPDDDWLKKRINKSSEKHKLSLSIYKNPNFLNAHEDLASFFRSDKKKFFQTEFYISQRKNRNILVDKDYKPNGGKWSYDAENRKKYPKDKTPPQVKFPAPDKIYNEAIEYVNKVFPKNIGTINESFLYPSNFKSAKKWLNDFLKTRFSEFGPYEDAIVSDAIILNHSVLTPMMNVGLLTPSLVVKKAIDFGIENEIPLNSLEGFIRQIIGWREFIRGVYLAKGVEERTKNFWGFNRKIPKSFYDGTTGIVPVDVTIKKVLETGYCHHIERLMILGNFMLLCEFDPDEVYRWFMELFIDAYDWVMVPNVYGMSQFADGGLMSTKPYISGSNYVMKMSNYKKGSWQEAWDGLFWRFMNVHREFFLKNPRIGMLVRTFDKMSEEKQNKHMDNADSFLTRL